MSDELPVLQDTDIIKTFNEFDIDNSGCITMDEFEKGVKRLKLPLSRTDITNIVHIIDTNKDGKISLHEFKHFALRQDAKIRHTFASLDIDKDHTLSATEIRTALQSQLNLEISSVELKSFIQQFSNIAQADKHEILFHNFRDKVLLLPAINTRYIYEAYRPSLSIDIGEDFTVPAAQTELSRHEHSKLNIFASGAICGAVSRTVTAPADRVKVMFQSGALEKEATIFETICNISNEGGIKSFWRGNGTNVLKIAPESAFKFMSYEILKKNKLICKCPDNPQIHERFIAGGLAGAVSQTAIYPLEIAKTRLALASAGEYNGIVGCLKSIVTKNGFGALYNGLGASVIGIVPYAGVDLAVYNTIKDYRAKQGGVNDGFACQHQQSGPSALEILLTGSISSVCGQVVAYPMQVMRTKLQSQGQVINLKLKDGSLITKTCVEYQGIADCFERTLFEHGVKGFYKGIMPNFMKAVPAISISYLVFEKTKPLLAPFV